MGLSVRHGPVEFFVLELVEHFRLLLKLFEADPQLAHVHYLFLEPLFLYALDLLLRVLLLALFVVQLVHHQLLQLAVNAESPYHYIDFYLLSFSDFVSSAGFSMMSSGMTDVP